MGAKLFAHLIVWEYTGFMKKLPLFTYILLNKLIIIGRY